jgi:hypothetical protein
LIDAIGREFYLIKEARPIKLACFFYRQKN